MKSPKSIFFLVLLFSAALLLPLSVVVVGSGAQEGLMSTIPQLLGGDSKGKKQGESSDFRDSWAVNRPGDFASVASDPVLDSKEGEDFLFFFWFKAREQPKFGEKIVAVSKGEGYAEDAIGYALGYVGAEGGAVRPYVFWRDSEKRGNAFVFSELELDPKTWYLFVLSFSDDQFLGIHVVPHGLRVAMKKGEKDSAKLMGGYTLEGGSSPKTDSKLVVGADRLGPFRGKIGSFGIFRGEGLSEKLPSVLEGLALDPRKVPRAVPEKYVQLFVVDGQKDLSSHDHRVKLHGTPARKER